MTSLKAIHPSSHLPIRHQCTNSTRDGIGCSWASGLTLSPPVIVGTIAGAGSFQPYVSA